VKNGLATLKQRGHSTLQMNEVIMKTLEKTFILAVSLLLPVTIIMVVVDILLPENISIAWRTTLVLSIPFLSYVVGYKFITGQRFRVFLPVRAISIKNIVLVFLIVACLIPGVTFLHLILGLFVEPSIFEYRFGGFLNYHFLIWILVIAVVPAIVEELVFRGAILHELQNRNSSKNAPILKAALISTALFAIAHLNVFQFVSALIMGMICAYFMHYSQNILVPIFAHFIWNALSVSLLHILSFFIPDRELFAAYYINMDIDMAIFGLTGTVLTIPLVILMIKFIKYNKRVVYEA
jgi:membrane protease YdiL (CAAX protease family)